MATSTNVDKAVDDLLTCTICLETLKVPKYLPCLHTFCETCIHTYITSSEKGGYIDRFQMSDMSSTCVVRRKGGTIRDMVQTITRKSLCSFIAESKRCHQI